jgi:long-chain fatty acid transport protein
MKRLAVAAAALLASTSLAQADISRTDQSVRILFEEVGASGNYVELSYGSVRPEANTAITPNPLNNYTLPGFGYRYALNDNLSFALTYDTPFGADVSYPGGAPFFGGNASVETQALTVMGRYEMGNGFSGYAGLRWLEASGNIYTNVAGAVFHQLDASSDRGLGYLVGAAYEVPEIALRVALTYNSPIDVNLTGTEQAFNPLTGLPVAAATPTNFDVEFPRSLNLEFQSGVAPGTLVFGSVRQQWWNGFNLTTGVGEYVRFTTNSTTYQIGVGRQFSENWSGSISYLHRTDGAIPSDTALSPTTGLDTITLAARYEQDALTVSGGITYGFPGDQIVNNAIAGAIPFEDNRVLGIGLRVGFRF